MIKKSLTIASFSYFIGILAFWLGKDFSSALWFAVGGGLTLLNFLLAASIVSRGIKMIKNRGLFLGLLLIKSLLFVAVICLVLMFTKPILLPFTLGIGIVIFGAVIAAILDGRHALRAMIRE